MNCFSACTCSRDDRFVISGAQSPRLLLVPRIRLVEQSYLTRNNVPFKLSLDGLASLFHLILLPLKEFIAAGKREQIFLVRCEGRKTQDLHKAKVRLDDNVESPCADKAAIIN